MFASLALAGCSPVSGADFAYPVATGPAALSGVTVLIYGDSLTQQTRDDTSAVLTDAGASVSIYEPNGGDSSDALENLPQILGGIDILVINTGLHDMTTLVQNEQFVPDVNRVEPNDFIANLRSIADLCEANGTLLVWRELYATQAGAPEYRNDDSVRQYRALAHIALDGRAYFVDAYEYTKRHPEFYNPDGVHMEEPGRSMVGQVVGGAIIGLGIG